MSRTDPIVEEIHAVREEIARAAGYDLERILETARERQAAAGVQAVRLFPKKPELVKKAS
ncbi:MAG: hypothetical protein ABJC13_18785 [Acidobacteriota bacterium]